MRHADVEEFSEGLICLSGCISGETNLYILNDEPEKARETVGWLVKTFGKANVYLEIHDHGFETQKQCMAELIKIGEEMTSRWSRRTTSTSWSANTTRRTMR